MKEEARIAWHGAGADVRFERSDFEILDLVLGPIPELGICALALKRARSTNLKLPHIRAKSLFRLLGKKRFEVRSRIWTAASIASRNSFHVVIDLHHTAFHLGTR